MKKDNFDVLCRYFMKKGLKQKVARTTIKYFTERYR